MKAPVTLNEVAIAAGVSKSTVANVFSRPERVRPELRERIETIARDLGYGGPDPRGRLLSLGRVNAIGVVPPAEAGFAWSFRDAYMQDFLTGVAEVCEERQVAMLLISARDRDGRSGIPRAVVDGMIVSTRAQADLVEPALRRRMPFVVVDAEAADGMSSLTFDQRGAARKLLRHLIGLGHRRFAFASINRAGGRPIVHEAGATVDGLSFGYEREWALYYGVSDALREAGLSMGDMPIIEACGSDEERRDYGDFADTLLEIAPGATAVIALAPSLTQPLLAAARRRKLAVPGDITVAGMDDRGPGAPIDPALTVLVEPVTSHDKGRLAAELLFEPEPRRVVLAMELVVGGSTA